MECPKCFTYIILFIRLDILWGQNHYPFLINEKIKQQVVGVLGWGGESFQFNLPLLNIYYNTKQLYVHCCVGQR